MIYIVEGVRYESLEALSNGVNLHLIDLEWLLHYYDEAGYPVTWVVVDGPATANYDAMEYLVKWTGDWTSFYKRTKTPVPCCPPHGEVNHNG